MKDQDRKIYMSLSNDPNERGILWKKRREKLNTSGQLSELEKKIAEKLTPQEIYHWNKTICVGFLAGLGIPPKLASLEFEKNFLERLKKYENKNDN